MKNEELIFFIIGGLGVAEVAALTTEMTDSGKNKAAQGYEYLTKRSKVSWNGITLALLVAAGAAKKILFEKGRFFLAACFTLVRYVFCCERE